MTDDINLGNMQEDEHSVKTMNAISDNHRKMLKCKKPELLDHLRDLNGILVHLEAAFILTDAEIDDIKAGKTDRDRIDKLISYLCKGSEAGFTKFLVALREQKQGYLAELLMTPEEQEQAQSGHEGTLPRRLSRCKLDPIERYNRTIQIHLGEGTTSKGAAVKMKCVVDLVFPDNSETPPDLSRYLTDIHRRRFVKDDPLVDILDSVEPISEGGFNLFLACHSADDYHYINTLHSTDELADVLKKMFFVDVLERSELLSGVKFKATIPKEEFKRVIKAISKQPVQGDSNNN